WQRRPELAHRVHSVLRRKHALNPVAARVALGAVGCGLLLGSVEMARCPQLFAFVQPALAQAALVQPGPGAAARNPAPTEARNMPAQLPNAHRAQARLTAGLRIQALHAQAERTGTEDRARGFQAVETSAIIPARQERASIALRALARRAAPQAVEANADPGAAPLAPRAEFAPHAEFLKARQRHNAPKLAEEQRWIVFTTWEQVQVPESAANSTSSNDPAPGATTTVSNPRTQSQVLSTRQIMITRLLLRIYPGIYPADSTQKQRASGVFESGWLVIQL
ncbi:MAG: hypothetical protein ACRD27_01580, partial [Terracidiphilus sp.]